MVVAPHRLVGRQLDQRRGASGDVVEHDRQVGGLGDGAEVVEQADLAGLVVVGAHQQDAVDADLGGLLGQLDGVGGGVGADARDHGGAVADGLVDRAQDVAVLRHGGRRALAGRAADDDAVAAVLDEVHRDPGRPVEVDAAVLVEGRGHRREQAAERGVGAHGGQVIARDTAVVSRRAAYCFHGVRRGAGAAHPRPARRRRGRDVEEDVRRDGLHGPRAHGRRRRAARAR